MDDVLGAYGASQRPAPTYSRGAAASKKTVGDVRHIPESGTLGEGYFASARSVIGHMYSAPRTYGINIAPKPRLPHAICNFPSTA